MSRHALPRVSIRPQAPPRQRGSEVSLALTLSAVAAGLVVGGLAGLRFGGGIQSRGGYWAANVTAVLGCMLLDFAGLMTGRYWIAYSALGLMGGLITGLKYGYVGSTGGWRSAETPAPPADEAEEAIEK
jgi:hypothetical protein